LEAGGAEEYSIDRPPTTDPGSPPGSVDDPRGFHHKHVAWGNFSQVVSKELDATGKARPGLTPHCPALYGSLHLSEQCEPKKKQRGGQNDPHEEFDERDSSASSHVHGK
jgi:hypothetical protein